MDQPLWIEVGEGVLVLLLGGILVAMWNLRRRLVTRDALAPALLTLLALLLRSVAHGSPADIRSVLDWNGTGRAGWTVALHFLRAIAPLQDDTMWWIDRVVGALAVPLLYAIVRRRCTDPITAMGAATALAVTPLIVRFSASDAPYVGLCTAFLGAVVAFDFFLDAPRLGTLLLSLGLLTTAMQLRPETPWLVVPFALLALSRRDARRPPLRASFAAAGLLFVGLNAVPTCWAFLGSRQGVSAGDFVLIGAALGSPWIDPNTTPLALATLLLLGAVAAVRRQRWTGTLWVLATLVAFPLDAPAVASGNAHGYSIHAADAPYSQYANARYHLPSMYLACGLIGLGSATLLDALGRWRKAPLPGAPLIAVAVVCVAAAPRLDLLQRMWTPQREFELFREGIRRLDPACRIVTLLNISDAGFIPFRYLAPDRIVDVSTVDELQGPDECLVYYRSGNCFVRELVPHDEQRAFTMHPACRRVEERFALEPLTEMLVPAVPFRGEVYARDPLPLGFYRLHPRQPDRMAP